MLFISGCAPTPERGERGISGDVDSRIAEQLELAQDALEQGDFLTAGEIFSGLAETTAPPESYRFQLEAAQALYLGGDELAGQQLLSDLSYIDLGPGLRLKRQMVHARIALQHDAEEALELLRTPDVEEHQIQKTDILAEYHLLKAVILSALGNHLEASREYMVREFYLREEVAIEQNQQAILNTLSQLSAPDLQRLRISPPPDLLSGWIDLSLLAREPDLTTEDARQRLAHWQEEYPLHPALYSVIDELVIGRIELHQTPGKVALLLPLSGRYAKVAGAVQDGFLAAYYENPQRMQQDIEVYDTGESPHQILLSYQRAVWEGAEFVVGPLTKEAVTYLAEQGEMAVPTLALNYAPDQVDAKIFQIALSPEDEARQVAELAWQNGFSRAAILVPNSMLGKRTSNSFAERWEELGGTISETITFNNKGSDYSRSIKSLLDVDKSDIRKRQLSATIGKRFEFTPRRRQDIDMIFLTAQPRQARLIKPQLTFHHGGSLPIYATSHLFSGEIDKNKDRDMDDILFIDIPWTLDAPSHNQRIKKKNSRMLSHHRGELQRLVALGVDAYQLVAKLRLLEKFPSDSLQGESGELSMGENMRIHRQLLLAQFQRGKPHLVKPLIDQPPIKP